MKLEEIKNKTKDAIDHLIRSLERGRSEVLTEYLSAMAHLPPPFTWGAPTHLQQVVRTLRAGMWASIEVATFQRRPTVEVVGKWGRRMAGIEVVVVSGQVALVLLALRGRFRF